MLIVLKLVLLLIIIHLPCLQAKPRNTPRSPKTIEELFQGIKETKNLILKEILTLELKEKENLLKSPMLNSQEKRKIQKEISFLNAEIKQISPWYYPILLVAKNSKVITAIILTVLITISLSLRHYYTRIQQKK